MIEIKNFVTQKHNYDRVWPITSLALAAAASLLLLFIPGIKQSYSPMGEIRNITLWHASEKRILFILLIPVVLCGITLILNTTRIRKFTLTVASLLLVLWVILSAASVGMFYIPCVVAMAIASYNSYRH